MLLLIKCLKRGLVILLLPIIAPAQNCDLIVSGKVKDLSTGAIISNASVLLSEIRSVTAPKGGVTDRFGMFSLSPVCPGKYHFTLSHVGCKSQDIWLDVIGDTLMTLFLDHQGLLLNEVDISSQRVSDSSEKNETLTIDNIDQKANNVLALMLEQLSGVSTIKNGNGISKPLIDGLFGNRLTVLNNGITQSGQQWGMDHAPEIDPLIANRVTIVRGVRSLEYQGNSLGTVVLVEPGRVGSNANLNGSGRYFFETNGRGSGLNLILQKSTKKLAWKAVGTVKKSGDHHTPRYYLTNTGSREVNASIQLEKYWSKNWLTEIYASSFNTELGVLRGSHIGNLTDLQSAFQRDVPFYTADDFSYSIAAPRQQVNHRLLKFHNKFMINDKQWFDLTYASQYNLRKEFDVRRNGRSDKPALSLAQLSNFMEGKYHGYLKKKYELKTGFQLNWVGNKNLPETGILPIIPDYASLEYGFFAIVSKVFNRTTFDLSTRYDWNKRNVATISTTIPREIIRYQDSYQNINLMGGVNHAFTKNWRISYNIGQLYRNPEVNELYSNGLHQGVSGIERGDPTLQVERSIKNTLSLHGKSKSKLSLDASFYIQHIDNYIFLNPQDEIRLTIRGAFPVFAYEQTDARLLGYNVTTSYQATKRIKIIGNYSFLDGFDKSNSMPLVYMAPNNLYTSFNYQIPEVIGLKNLELEINSRFVFEQKNILLSQDFLAPPASYNLLGFKISADKNFKTLRLKFFIRAENALNTSYREYLNRQRYFADDLGLNIITGLKVSF
jgi:iron complex outermembrane receptor protein